MGYNGSLAGEDHCGDVGCIIGFDGRCKNTIHAEANALIVASRNSIFQQGGSVILWSTHMPCLECTKLAIGMGIDMIVYWLPYPWMPNDDGHAEMFLRLSKRIRIIRYGHLDSPPTEAKK